MRGHCLRDTSGRSWGGPRGPRGDAEEAFGALSAGGCEQRWQADAGRGPCLSAEADRQVGGGRRGAEGGASGKESEAGRAGDKARSCGCKLWPHANNKLDLWLAKAERPTPLVVFIHGGGFVGGDKSGASEAAI